MKLYRVAFGVTVDQLEDNVAALVDMGYTPTGGLIAIQDDYGNGPFTSLYQAMWLTDPGRAGV